MPEEIPATGQAHSADEGVTLHGAEDLRGLDAVPTSVLFEGRFGRMFRSLPRAVHDDATLIALGRAMSERPSPTEPDNGRIGSGYTYLGQFVDHDITFDPTSLLSQLNDPDALHDFRSPRFDLDSMYGAGPAGTPYLYEFRSDRFAGVKLLTGRNPATNAQGESLEQRDLQRNRQERALTGDPRNDENIIIGQLHLAFITFHNRVCDIVDAAHPAFGRRDLFAEARRLVTWHYQWLVVQDFLPRVAGQEVVDTLLTRAPDGSLETHLEFFTWEVQPFIPVEFSAAAYRFGHSMVRPTYDLNDVVVDVPIFAPDPQPAQLSHLGGFRALPAAWTVDWHRFVRIDGSRPQLSRLIDTHLSPPLLKLPLNLDQFRNPLPVLNLRRGKALKLPSGQSVATAMGIAPIPTADLGLGGFGLTAAQRSALEAATPLWYYILREAELGGGHQLGAVGGRIVAEVLIGLLAGDPQSFLGQNPKWRPEGVPAADPGTFTLADLLKLGVP